MVDAKEVANKPLSLGMKAIIAFHVWSACMWLLGQSYSVYDYDWVASLGLQNPREVSDPAVIGFNKAIAMADTLTMIPLHILAALFLARRQFSGVILSWMAFATDMYWNVLAFTTEVAFYIEDVKHNPLDVASQLVVVAIFLFSVWGCWYQCRNKDFLSWWEKDF